MKVAVVYNAVIEDRPDESDVLVQVATVKDALESLGHDTAAFACTLNLEHIQSRLKQWTPDIVFNLVESLASHGRLIHLVPALLDAIGLSYTGSRTEAIIDTTNKIRAKECLLRASLPTPEWLGPVCSCRPLSVMHRNTMSRKAEDFIWIVKSLWEHASVGLSESSLVKKMSYEDLVTLLRTEASRLGGECFAEVFIEGREFNLSLLAAPEGPEVLPPAEIIFEGYDSQKAKIVDYRAKWDDSSYEYQHTLRRFDFQYQDRPILKKLSLLALKSWEVFDLSGYARVDFRVDERGNPWILEINTNPCLSPDAGFAAALNRGNITYPEAVSRILADANREV